MKWFDQTSESMLRCQAYEVAYCLAGSDGGTTFFTCNLGRDRQQGAIRKLEWEQIAKSRISPKIGGAERSPISHEFLEVLGAQLRRGFSKSMDQISMLGADSSPTDVE